MMSLGTWTRRSTKYQKFLNLSNVFLLIVSTGLLFTSVVLMSFYHMTKVRGPLSLFTKLFNNHLSSWHSGLGISTPSPCACWSWVSTHSPCLSTGFSSQPESPSMKAARLSRLVIINCFYFSPGASSLSLLSSSVSHSWVRSSVSGLPLS